MLLDLLVGPMLIGTVLNVWLFGFMCTQCFLYFGTYKSDPLWLRSLVVLILVADTINSALDVAFVYEYTVSHFADFHYIQISSPVFNSGDMSHSFYVAKSILTWSLLDPIMTVILSATVQIFFGWRVWKLTDQLWLGLLIVFLAFVSFLCGIGTTIGCVIVKEFVQFQKFRVVVILWLGVSVLTDSLITIALTYHLRQKRTGFHVTDSLINSILRITIQTGLLTTVVATVDLICFVTMANTIHLIFNLPLGKLYSNSMLSTLNARAEWGNSAQGLHVKPISSGAAHRRTRTITPPDATWESRVWTALISDCLRMSESSIIRDLNFTNPGNSHEQEQYELTNNVPQAPTPENNPNDRPKKREFGEISDSDLNEISNWIPV